MSDRIEEIRSAMEARLSAESFAHCERTSDAAYELAEVYHVDPDQAQFAGLLHDWDRDTPKSELVAMASANGSIQEFEMKHPKLLHARTGAANVRKEYPDLPDDVYAAVERHTVGSANMSDLDKVVYIADMIEPGREWPGVEELRRCVGEVSLDQLFFLAYRASLENLLRRRKRLHPATVEVWNSLVAKDAK